MCLDHLVWPVFSLFGFFFVLLSSVIIFSLSLYFEYMLVVFCVNMQSFSLFHFWYFGFFPFRFFFLFTFLFVFLCLYNVRIDLSERFIHFCDIWASLSVCMCVVLLIPMSHSFSSFAPMFVLNIGIPVVVRIRFNELNNKTKHKLLLDWHLKPKFHHLYNNESF